MVKCDCCDQDIPEKKPEDNNTKASKLVSTFETGFNKLIEDFLTPLNNNDIKISTYGKYPISDQTNNRISDIITIINRYKIMTRPSVWATLNRIEIEQPNSSLFYIWIPNPYYKLILNIENPISTTQNITWGKQQIYITVNHTEFLDKRYKIGGRYKVKYKPSGEWEFVKEGECE